MNMRAKIAGWLLIGLLVLAGPAKGLAQGGPPIITANSQSMTVTQGNSVTFWVMVSSTSTPTYQWKFNGANIFGATATNYIISNVQSNQAGPYSVAITNSAGDITTTNIILTVRVPPRLTTQPQSQTKLYTSNVTFTAVATGNTPFTYQWKFNGTNIAGMTTTSCTITNLQLTNAGNYTVLVSNPYGSTNSTPATLSVTYINLTPAQAPGWSDKIVVSTAPGTHTNNSPLTTTNTLYIDFALVNNGTAGTSGPFINQLYLDGVLMISPAWSGGISLSPGNYFTISDYSPGMLSEGNHTLLVKVDSANQINELDETDNTYIRVITVIGPPAPLLLTANGFVSNGFQLTVSGPASVSVVIETSTDLSVWTPGYTNTTSGTGNLVFTDTNAFSLSRRYYRGLLQ